MDVTTLRGHSALDQPAQVAEIHARGVTGYGGLAPLQVELTSSGDPDRLGATVRGWNDHNAQEALRFDVVRTTQSGPAVLRPRAGTNHELVHRPLTQPRRTPATHTCPH